MWSNIFASTADGTVSGYAWSDKAGYINFGTSAGNIHVLDGSLSGYAWSSNYGWINLSPTQGGVSNDSEGNLSGYAWGENLGWIDFSEVTINSSGLFTGTAVGENSGTINFSCNNCNVTTDWRPASSRNTTPNNNGGGGGGSSGYASPSLPLGILINGGANYTNKKSVELTFVSGDDSKYVIISNYSDFHDAKKEKIIKNKIWQLQDIDGEKFVYVKFFTDHNIESSIIKDSIILDTVEPSLTIEGLKGKYFDYEEVIFSGKTENSAVVDIFLDNSYGNFSADLNGEFFITLGKLLVGNHSLKIQSRDLAGNISSVFVFNFSVDKKDQISIIEPKNNFLSPIIDRIKEGFKLLVPNLEPVEQKPVAQVPILDKIGQGLYSLIPFLPHKQNNQIAKLPKPIVMVPSEPQSVFSGKWNIFPKEPIKKFVLAPLPKDIAVLEQKFPELKKTFNEVGVDKITDLQKIKNTNLSLPNLTQTLGLSKIEISPGKFLPAKGIPITKLTPDAKSKIPSEIIFAKTGGGLIDYNIALSLNDKGQAQQKIKTLTASPLELVFKTDGNVKKVRGYIIFKSKKPSPSSTDIPLESLSLSPLFLAPSLTASLTPMQRIPIEGAKVDSLDNKSDKYINIKTSSSSDSVIEIEKRLVISEFEFQDSGDGVYTAVIQTPVVDGEYEIITVVDYEKDGSLETISKEVKLVTVVDPEGYVYEKDGDKETRIIGAVVSLYWQNPSTKQYELWPAGEYQQENPQVTNVSGTYSFLVPEGYYYLKVDSPGYLSYDGKPFSVKEGSGVHINIELKTRYWWLNIIDWKTLLLIVVILMLFYNFYRDRKRERLVIKQ